MLLQFNFENFRSFHHPVSLDFTALKSPGNEHHIRSAGKEKVLPLAGIHGANASGKSNVIEAFRFMRNYVLHSFAYEEQENQDSFIQREKYSPYLLDEESRTKPSVFEVYFALSDDPSCMEYQYGFAVDETGVVEEWLNTKAKTARKSKIVFCRSETETDLSGLKKTDRNLLLAAVSRQNLLLSLGARLNIRELKRVRDWFMKSKVVSKNVSYAGLLPDGFSNDPAVRKDAAQFLSACGVSDTDDACFEISKIRSEHLDSQGNRIHLPLEQESQGTLKMLYLYKDLKSTLQDGTPLWIDDLDSSLHPLLVRNLLLTFSSIETNPNGAQLIFTAHDVWELMNNSLRKDEVWFTEKTESSSDLYSLSDFVLNRDNSHIGEDIARNYLLGKYGAIPSLKQINLAAEDTA